MRALLLAAALGALSTSCATTGVARDVVHDELTLLPDDARLFAALLESDNPELAADLREIAQFVQDAHEAYHATASGDPNATAVQRVDEALDALVRLLPEAG